MKNEKELLPKFKDGHDINSLLNLYNQQKSSLTITVGNTNYFEKIDFISFLSFLNKDVFKNQRLFLRSHDTRFGYLDNIKCVLNPTSNIPYDLLTFLKNNDRFHLVLGTSDDFYENETHLELTFVQEGLYITKGMSPSKQLFNELLKNNSNSKFNFLAE